MHVRPHNRTIAKALRKSERQVCRYLRVLTEERLLRRQTRKYYHATHHKFLTSRVLITLKFQGQSVFGEPWYGDPAPNLKLDDDVKTAIAAFPEAQRRDEERQHDPEYLAKKSRLMAALRAAQIAAGGDNREARANPTIARIMRALQELSS
jgi:transcriptional regulator of met regulon